MGTLGVRLKIRRVCERGMKDRKSYLDKDTHTWRWWSRRVVTRLLQQPADTGQEETEEKMAEKVEVQQKEKEEEMRKERTNV